jgi:hypothetical protein
MPDGVRVAEQSGSGAVGGPAGVEPSAECVEQQGAIMLGSLVERAEDGSGDGAHDLWGAGRGDGQRVPVEDGDLLPVACAAKSDPGEFSCISGLAQVVVGRAGSDMAFGRVLCCGVSR